MSCEFCEERKSAKAAAIGKGIPTAYMNIQFLFGMRKDEDKKIDCVFLEDENMLGYDSSSGEYAPQFVKIKFCPFCGRELAKK